MVKSRILVYPIAQQHDPLQIKTHSFRTFPASVVSYARALFTARADCFTAFKVCRNDCCAACLAQIGLSHKSIFNNFGLELCMHYWTTHQPMNSPFVCLTLSHQLVLPFGAWFNENFSEPWNKLLNFSLAIFIIGIVSWWLCPGLLIDFIILYDVSMVR